VGGICLRRRTCGLQAIKEGVEDLIPRQVMNVLLVYTMFVFMLSTETLKKASRKFMKEYLIAVANLWETS